MNTLIAQSCRWSATLCLILLFTSLAWSQTAVNELKMRAEQFVAANETKLQNNPSLTLSDRFTLLDHLSGAALAAGDLNKAENFVKQLASVGEQLRTPKPIRNYESPMPWYANYISNTILGLIALENSDISKAKQHLLAAGRREGKTTPAVLASFGPTMRLAKKLIEKGEGETVIEYFDLCADYWKPKDEDLEKWKDIVKQGIVPDFGRRDTGFDIWQIAAQ